MNGIVYWLGLSKQLEVLVIILIGGALLMCDDALFQLKRNLEEVWHLYLDDDIFPINYQYYIKYAICAIIIVRTFTLHLFLALYVVMLWPAIFADRPGLMLPWLLVGLVRSVVVNISTLFLGSYICFFSKGACLFCFDYILSQVIDHGPAVYSWFVVMSFYTDLRALVPIKKAAKQQNLKEIAKRRRLARYMALAHLNFDHKADDGRNLISESTIDSMIHFLHNNINLNPSRSLDSLFNLRAAQEQKEEIMSIESNTEAKYATLQECIMTNLQITHGDIAQARIEANKRNLMMLSDLNSDKVDNSDMKNDEVLSTVSSDSFFVKNGKSYTSRKSEQLLRQTMSPLPETVDSAMSSDEVELGNVILETKKCSACAAQRNKRNYN